jgi:exosortase N
MKIGKFDRFTAFLTVFIALLIGVTLRRYLVFDATFVVGLAVLPFCFKILKEGIFSMRYIFWLLPTLVLAILTHSFTLFYLASVAALLLVWESRIGKLSILPPLLFVLISPVFRYATDVFTFDFRLKLTEFAAQILKKIDTFPTESGFPPSNSGSTVSAVGNLIKLKDGGEWQIDEACMGLNMLGISLILTVFFIAYFAERQKKIPILLTPSNSGEIPIPSGRGVFLLILAALFLNIVCNLLRIIALVHFRVLPHTVGHDIVGLLALVLYVVVPMFFLIKKVAQYDWFFSKKTTSLREINFPTLLKIHVVIFLVLLAKGLFLIIKNPDATADEPPKMTLAGFQKTILPNGVCQFSNDNFLIYVKPLKSFYTTEHSPMICWRGSGFEFKQIEKKTIGATEIYTGILAKGDSTLHTAWWFENEQGERTIEQKTWRWASFTEGVHFRLVNVSAADSLALRRMIIGWEHR